MMRIRIMKTTMMMTVKQRVAMAGLMMRVMRGLPRLEKRRKMKKELSMKMETP
jgi:hypothetical protein